MIIFCKGRGAFRELDGQYILPLENGTYCAFLMTNKPYLLKNHKKPKDKSVLKGDLDVQNRHSAVVNTDEKSL